MMKISMFLFLILYSAFQNGHARPMSICTDQMNISEQELKEIGMCTSKTQKS